MTLRSVAAAAGVSVGRIQHYFSSKEEMLRYGCHAMIAVTNETFRARIFGTEPSAAFRALVTHAIPVSNAQKLGTAVWYAYLAYSVNDPEIAAALCAAKKGEENEGLRLLRAAQAAGEVTKDHDALAATRTLLTLADGLALRVFIGQLDSEAALGVLEQDLANRF